MREKSPNVTTCIFLVPNTHDSTVYSSLAVWCYRRGATAIARYTKTARAAYV